MALRRLIAGLVLGAAVVVCSPAAPAEAGIVRGLQEIVAAAFAVPLGVLQGTLSGPPVIGTLTGAVGGVFRTVTLVGGGVVDILSDAIPLAKAIGPFLLPFLF